MSNTYLRFAKFPDSFEDYKKLYMSTLLKDQKANMLNNFKNNALAIDKSQENRKMIRALTNINKDNYPWIINSIEKSNKYMKNVPKKAPAEPVNPVNTPSTSNSGKTANAPPKANPKHTSDRMTLEEGERILYIESRVQIHDKQQNVKKWLTDYTYLITKTSTADGLTAMDQKILEHMIIDKYESYEYSVEEIEKSPLRIRNIDPNTDFEKLKAKHKALAYKMLEDLNGNMKERTYNDNYCVLRFILQATAGKVQLTLPQLKQQLSDLGIDFEKGVSVQEMKRWILKYYPKKISMFALDPLYKVFDTYIAGNNVVATLMFIVNNAHVYPIWDAASQKSIAKAKRMNLSEVIWEIDSTKYHKIEVAHNIEDNPLDYGLNAIVNTEYEDLVNGKRKNDCVILIENNLEDVAKEIIKANGYQVTAMLIRNSEIQAFQHPVTHQVIQYAPDCAEREFICKKLYTLFPYECFLFKNQSYAQIAVNLFELTQGRIPKSHHIREDQIIIDNYHTRPAIKTLLQDYPYNPETCYGFDIRKSYATAVMTMEDNYPSFSICDTFEKYKGEDIVIGEYLIDDINIAELGGFEIPKQVIGHNEAKFLLNRKYIEKKDILFVKKASYYIQATHFAKFIEFLKNTFDEGTFKIMANCFIGQLGKRFNTKDRAFITNDWETVCGSFNVHSKGSNERTCKTIEDLHFIKVSEKNRIFGECSQIFRQIVSQGRIQLMKLLEYVYDPEQSVLVGYNTDSVFVDKPKVIISQKTSSKEKTEKKKVHTITKKCIETEIVKMPLALTAQCLQNTLKSCNHLVRKTRSHDEGVDCHQAVG